MPLDYPKIIDYARYEDTAMPLDYLKTIIDYARYEDTAVPLDYPD